MKTLKVVNGDFVRNEATGRFETVEGTVKLGQDVRENLLTDPQEDGTGAGMGSFVGQVGDPIGLRIDMTRALHDSFSALRSRQRSIQAYERKPEERIRSVTSVVVAPVRTVGGIVSNTTYEWRVEVASDKAGVAAPVAGVISASGLRASDSVPQGNPVQVDIDR